MKKSDKEDALLEVEKAHEELRQAIDAAGQLVEKAQKLVSQANDSSNGAQRKPGTKT